jgi:hypothetical protein
MCTEELEITGYMCCTQRRTERNFCKVCEIIADSTASREVQTFLSYYILSRCNVYIPCLSRCEAERKKRKDVKRKEEKEKES